MQYKYRISVLCEAHIKTMQTIVQTECSFRINLIYTLQ